MDKFIKLDVAMGTIAKIIEHTKDKKAKEVLFQVGDAIMDCPSADVVPRSEYDAVVSAVDNSTKEFLKLHDAYQGQKRELEALTDERDRYKRYYFNHEYDELEAEAKQEVARELGVILVKYNSGCYGEVTLLKYLAELKKKYIGKDINVLSNKGE